MPEYEVNSQYDERTESYRLLVRKQIHGNIQVSQIDQDFVEGGNYAQLRKTGQVLQGLLGSGAYVRRGEQQQPVTEFKQALDWLLDQVKNAVSVQRYKGLGEMNPEQLWETTMDPSVRRLLKVQIDDAIGADEIFTTLMGDQVEPRRAFIETNALIARNIDV
jgi:DNA gyrase subunit B